VWGGHEGGNEGEQGCRKMFCEGGGGLSKVWGPRC
jgi:hypothetical protein